MIRDLCLVIPGPAYILGMLVAILITSSVSSKEIMHHEYFQSNTAKDIYGSQSKTSHFRPSFVKVKRNDVMMSDHTASMETSTQVLHTRRTHAIPSSDAGNNDDSAGEIKQGDTKYEDDVSPIAGDDEIHGNEYNEDYNDNERNDDYNDTMDFNITAAVEKGLQAQYKLCDRFCDGNSSFPIHQDSDSCRHTDTWCYPCSCDQACAHYGDCCPSVGSTSMPQIGVQAHLCLNVNIGRWNHIVEVIASCPDPDNVQGESHNEDCARCGANDSEIWGELVVSQDTHVLYCNNHCALCNGETNFTAVARSECENAGKVRSFTDQPSPTDSVYSPSFSSSAIPTNSSKNDDVIIVLNGPDITQTTNVQVLSDATTFPPLLEFPRCGLNIPGKHLPFVRTFSCRYESVLSFESNSTEDFPVRSNKTEEEVMEELCHQYSYPIWIRGLVYRNLFCALIDGVVPGQKQCPSHVLDREMSGLDILTSLREPVIVQKTASFASQQCQDGYGWYDVVADTCRPVSCENGRHWLDGQAYCVHQVPANKSIVYTYILHVVFQPRINSTRFGCSHQGGFVQDGAINHLARMMQQLNITTYAIQRQCVQSYYHPTKIFFYLQFIKESDDGEGQVEFEMKLVDYFAAPNLTTMVSYNGSSVELDMTLSSGFLHWAVQETMITFPDGTCCYQTHFSNLNLTSLYTRVFDKNVSSHYIDVPFGPFTLNAQVVLNVTEYDRVTDDLYSLSYANISLDAHNLQLTEYGLVMPFIFLQNIYTEAGLVPDQQLQTELRYRSIGTEFEILSFCCLIVSVISLLFLLTTYSVFPELRTVPGINMMFLAAWLLVAQLLLLTVPGRTEVDSVCQALAMILHYSWLCVVTWCSVCSFHMFDVFVRQQDMMHMPHRHEWYIKRYTALAHSLPALIIGLVVVCMAASTDGKDLGYGGYVCYLNSMLLVGLAFVLPLGLSVTLNLVLLLLTARAVSRVERQHVTGTRAERNSIHIYIGLSSLTGLCWLVALIAEIPGCGWLHYVSAVLNGLQGLHLALSFACSKRVMKMWRHKLRCRTSHSQRSLSLSVQSRRTIPSFV